MGAVHRRVALESGVSRDVLEGVQFRRLHEAVYVHRDHEMTWADHVEAARLALPTTARTTGVTRLRQLGLDVGAVFPLHFVIEGDHHLVLDGVFLHRTVKMPACDEVGATIEAAFVAFCAEARLIDAIGVGSYLLHEELLDLRLLDLVLTKEKWRRGVPEAVYALPHLEGRCRSIPEARLFASVVFASLPMPEVNRSLRLDDGVELTPDSGSRTTDWWWSTRGRITRTIAPSTTPTSTATRSTGGTTCRTSWSPRNGCDRRRPRSGGFTRHLSLRATTGRRRTSVSCGTRCSCRSASSYAEGGGDLLERCVRGSRRPLDPRHSPPPVARRRPSTLSGG
ncbi:hypothetical protein [Nocardioides lacusdianchii]|uniref:hypothetical protein n=1 Tax=Nocardioides lacusdianchii TaxID=2783664 RepID=UPI001CC9A064|nr:hypothetical protein [Nocardioides lacusdianchii]